MRFPDNIIWDLLELRWWDYCFTDFGIEVEIPIEQSIYKVNNDIAAGKIQKFNPVPLSGAEILATGE